MIGVRYKQQFSLCPTCKNNIRNEYHLSTAHGIDIHTYNEIWTEICSYHDKTVEIHKKKKGDLEKVKRSKYLISGDQDSKHIERIQSTNLSWFNLEIEREACDKVLSLSYQQSRILK